MSLRSEANLVRNATQVDPPENDEERIGGLFQEIAKATETVDTIADLRAFDTTDLENGDIVEIRAHGSAGLEKKIGGGKFVWITTPLFTVDEVGGISSGETDGVSVTPTTTGFALPALGTYTKFLPKLSFSNGVSGNITQSTSLAGDRDVNIAVGATSLDLNVDGAVPQGTEAYRQDDDGVWIRPTSGDGYFQRILDENTVSPEMYGAIPNFSWKDGAVNECSSAIQAAFDSPWNVRMYGGAYYIDTPIQAERGKSIFMPPSGYVESDFEENRRVKLNDTAVSSIYITTNIDIVIVRCTDLRWNYGVLDARQAPSTADKAAFKYDMSANLAFSTLNRPHVVGSKDRIQSGVNNGITAVLIDIENSISDQSIPNTFGIGSLYYTYFDFSAEYCHTAYWVNGQPIDENQNYYTNSVRVNMISQRNKRAVYMESTQSSSYFTGFHQATNALEESNKDWAVSTLKGIDMYYDIFAFDLSDQLFNGFYRNEIATDMSDADVTIGPYGAKNSHNINNYSVGSVGSPQFQRSSTATKLAPQITRLNNSLALPVQRGFTYNIDAYDGTGVDLTTTLTSSEGVLTPSANVDINSPNNLFDLTESDGTEVVFNTGADLTNDFVELEITNCAGALWTEKIQLLLNWDGQVCNQIQVITGQSGDLGQQTIDVTENFDNIQRGERLYTFDADTLNFGFAEDVLRIRFIGLTAIGSYKIREIIASAAPSPYFPYIHTQGGQEIFGSLEVESLTLSSSTVDGATTTTFVNPDKRLTRTITSSEILSSNTTPIELIDLSNFAIHPKHIRVSVTNAGTDYATNTNLGFRIQSTSESGSYFATIDLSDLPNEINDKFLVPEIVITDIMRSGGTLFLETETGDPTGGTKDLLIEFDYEEVRL